MEISVRTQKGIQEPAPESNSQSRTYLVLEREERERVLVHNNNRIIDDEATEGVRSLSRPDAAPPQQRM